MITEEKLKRILSTGKASFGSKQAINDLLNGNAKMIIIASNCPRDIKEDIEKYSETGRTPVSVFEGTSLQLGELCGKPFLIAAISVKDLGEVQIKDVTKGEKK